MSSEPCSYIACHAFTIEMYIFYMIWRIVFFLGVSNEKTEQLKRYTVVFFLIETNWEREADTCMRESSEPSDDI